MASRGDLTAVIVSVGNELLFGETVDTNAAWLGRRLTGRGIRVIRGYTVGDDPQAIHQALSAAVDMADLVMVTGGLGPTPDDLTKEVVARHFGLELVVDDGVAARLRQHFGASGYDEVPPRSRGQAEIPLGATALENPSGTAPGILLEAEGTVVVLLPGVPGELRDIVDGSLAEHLDALSGTRTHHRVVHTTGLAETSLAERLEARLDALPTALTDGIGLAYLPDVRGVDLRFTLPGMSEEDADVRFSGVIEALDDVLGPWRFKAESGDIVEALSDELRARRWTVAVAESCTGGLVGKRLTDPAGASAVFVGGVVAYDNRIKVEVVGVSEKVLERDGSVSEAVAKELAAGVARRFGVPTGIGVTGVAGPGGGSEEKPVGTVWIATSVEGRTEATLHRLSGDREAVRERAAQAALASLYRRLVDSGGGA